MDKSINLYDYEILETSGQHGSDISSQRIDIIDRKSLNYVMHNKNLKVVDLGCGLASQGFRFSIVGADVTLIDVIDIEKRVQILDKLFEIGNINYINKKAQNVNYDNFDEMIDVVYSQRFIHYLKYNKAKSLLKKIRDNMASNGRIYISASGIDSELSKNYEHKNKNIQNRFCKLSNHMANKHEIHKPVCLYSKRDMVDLIEKTGFKLKYIKKSNFGNIKAIAEIERNNLC